MALAYVGLGSNLGDRAAHIAAARKGLANLPESALLDNAPTYETKPVGGPAGQQDYYNSVSTLETGLEPLELLRATQALERDLGRRREQETIRWGPRVIDIDILLYEDRIVEEPDLIIPHPRLARRAFALAPLADIDGDILHPVADMTIRELLERIEPENEGLRRVSL